MGQVHFKTFLSSVRKAYQGNGKGPKKALSIELKDAKITGLSFDNFIATAKAYALKSAEAEGAAFQWDKDDVNLEASFASDKGDSDKAAALHFYFLCHGEYAARAKVLNKTINLPKLMDGQFEAAVFGFRIPSDADGAKRIHPIPPRPTANFDWPEYVSEEDANAPDADEGVWLNPLNHFSIPLSHRQTEQDLLDAFINDDRRFLICAIVAPSGAGKTRLVSQWMRKFVPIVSDTDWDAGFIKDRATPRWENWTASRNMNRAGFAGDRLV